MACATLYTYCVYELRMSEDEAQRRCRAARLCRQFPVLLEMLADASIHLTGILLIGPHLSDDNHKELLARARYRTKREIEKLVAEIAPRADVPARIEPLYALTRAPGGHAAMMAALCGHVRNLPPGNGRGEAPVGTLTEIPLVSEPPTPEAVEHVESVPAPSSPPMQYKIQFSADQEYIDLLEEARDLLAHDNPSRDFVEVQRKALEVLVTQLLKRKHASRAGAAAEQAAISASDEGDDSASEPAATGGDHSIRPSARPRARRPTAAIARAVWQRDQGHCTYVDTRGQRCRETAMLEIHHEHAHALGGAASLENLRLLCRAHNTLLAEQDFGREHMARVSHPEAERPRP